MSCQATVKSFNAKAGWGFISLDGQDVFLHVKECGPTFRPKAGADVSFDTEDSPKQPGQLCAKNVKALRNGSCEGTVKSFVDNKGYGFIDYEGADVFLHINDCVDGRPDKGDQVNFDVEDSDKTPNQKVAKRVVGCSRLLEIDGDKGKGKGGKGDKGDKGGKGFDAGFGKGGGYGPAPMYGGYDKGGWGGPPMGYGGPPMGYGGPPGRFLVSYGGPPMGYGGYGGGCDKGGYGGYGGGCDKGGYGGGYGMPYGKGCDKGYDKGGYGKGGYGKGKGKF